MTQFVRVEVKETGAHIVIDEANVSDAVKVLAKVDGPELPNPKPSPKKGGSNAGDAGTTKKES